jgi:hypothetical protein
MKANQIAQLAGINKEDFTVEGNGKVHLATRKVGVLLGVPESTLRGWIKESRALYNVNEKNQLDPESIVKIAKLAHLKYKQADIFLDKILIGGCNELLQGLVGFIPKQLTEGEQLVANAQYLLKMEKSLKLKAEQAQVDLIEKTVTNLQDTVRGSHFPYGTLPAYKMAKFFNVNLDEDFKDLLKQARSYQYYFASGANNAKRKATAYEIEDVRTLLENY